MATSGEDEGRGTGTESDSQQFQTRRVDNQHYDEELLVVDGENVPSRASFIDRDPGDGSQNGRGGDSEQDGRRRGVGESDRPYAYGSSLAPPDQAIRGRAPAMDGDAASGGAGMAVGRLDAPPHMQPHMQDQDEADGRSSANMDDPGDSDELDDGSDDDQAEQVGLYDPAEYENLPVGAEVKDLFKHITQYTPVTVELVTKLRPFIPDFLPAVGDIDGFVKVERPDGEHETLGLNRLDEPCSKQSDPTVLDLQLRRMTKEKRGKEAIVHSIEDGVKNKKAIDNWVTNISELHRQKPAPTVNPTGVMPDIETLMKEWPSEYEEALKKLPLPSADLDCDLPTYADIVCGLLDIPVHKNRIESLHTLFSLYSEFKNSQHFQDLTKTEPKDADLAAATDVADV